MTKDKATRIALGFVYGELLGITDKSLNQFWQGVLASLQDLLSGEWEYADLLPFICYQTLKDTPVGPMFLEAWGADIGRQGADIHQLFSSLEDGLR
jgi:hypothetical protein